MSAKIRCAILDDYQQVALSYGDWSSLSDRIETQVFSEHIADENALAAALSGAEIIVIMRERTPFTASLLARLPALKLLITSGMRNASIDMAAAKAQGVKVCGTGSGGSAPVELTWALILGLARHLVTESNALREDGPWQSTVGFGLSGKRLGLIGLGKLGQKTAEVGKAFGMNVVAWSQNLTAERAAEHGVEFAASKEALLAASDVVSIHLVLSERSRGLIDAADLALMKPLALLINTSRAAIVDQPALIAALQAGKIGGAGLDVFDVEPLPASHPFRSLSNVLATPHIGYVADGNYRIYFTEAVENIEAYLAGEPVRVLS